MCSPPETSATTDPIPWGHSAAAHRVHGWCAICDGRGYAKEALAWRVRENRRHDAAQAAVAASETRRNPWTCKPPPTTCAPSAARKP
ncbi:hypothetical protein [Streptomyces cadmiisoli]|uniref:hypothetical protein n=1 Tax=Streptomyces cadmiisoli TaxID=2184053 RepID=UPI0036574055